MSTALLVLGVLAVCVVVGVLAVQAVLQDMEIDLDDLTEDWELREAADPQRWGRSS